MNLAVITPAYYPTEEPYKLLRDSCAAHHLPLYPFGQGQPWPGDLTAHFTGALEALHNLPSIYDLVMFTDAEDTFVMAGAEEIEALFRAYSCPLLLSAEQDLYPWGLEPVWEGSVDTRPPAVGNWQYPNGGGWIGRPDALKQILADIKANMNGDEAQTKWVNAYCSGRYGIQLDQTCQIFQTMSNGGDQHLEKLTGARLRNNLTLSNPVVVHFNGKLGGIKKLYKAVYG